ncbi:hypothetical protein ABZV80_44735 [Streptomyces sp. NPDC005132]|uniref:hypothetical protein n=1 Tax=Streptomyces sp. NPDC005132 TaxID=3154294 RepID=UPI0033BE2595
MLLTTVFVVVNSQVVYAATSSSGDSGDLLSPLDIASSEGVAINGYELNASGGSIVAFKSQALAFALSGLFTLIRLLVGLAGWAIELAFRFPLLKILAAPAQKAADTYNSVIVDTLGLKGVLLAWAFVFGGFMLVRGRVGRGLGEIFLTLLIAAFAASAFVRPDYLLAQGGPLGQGQQVAGEVAQESVNSYDWGGKLANRGPCDGMAGRAELKCLQQEGEGPVSAGEVARPIQDSITNALIVKPYMLLQYGRILDPAKASDRRAYAVHLKWITGGYKAGAVSGKDDPCGLLKGPAKKWCQREHVGQSASHALPEFTPGGDGRRVCVRAVLRDRRGRDHHQRARPDGGADPADRRAGHRRRGRPPQAAGRHHILRSADGDAHAVRQGRRHPHARRHLGARRRPRHELSRSDGRLRRRPAGVRRRLRRPVRTAGHSPAIDGRARVLHRRGRHARRHRRAAR